MVLEALAIVLFVLGALFSLLAVVRLYYNLMYIQHRQPRSAKWSGVFSALFMTVVLGAGGWLLLSA